jgi:hypothetical protein
MLHIALNDNNKEKVELLFKKFPNTINETLKCDGDSVVHTFLHSYDSSHDIGEILRENCDNIDWKARDKNNKTALQIAQEGGRKGVFTYLLAQEVTYTAEDFLPQDFDIKKYNEDLEEFMKSDEQDVEELGEIRDEYLADPEAARRFWMEEFGMKKRKRYQRGYLLSLKLIMGEGLLKVREEKKETKEGRFFNISAKLPLELQMMLCNYAQDHKADSIPSKYVVGELTTIVKELVVEEINKQ